MEQFSHNRNNCIIRQRKKCGHIDKRKYKAQCLELLQASRVLKLKHNPTKSFENKIQRKLRKL